MQNIRIWDPFEIKQQNVLYPSITYKDADFAKKMYKNLMLNNKIGCKIKMYPLYSE